MTDKQDWSEQCIISKYSSTFNLFDLSYWQSIFSKAARHPDCKLVNLYQFRLELMDPRP